LCQVREKFCGLPAALDGLEESVDVFPDISLDAFDHFYP
jgi:hypothetical protein